MINNQVENQGSSCNDLSPVNSTATALLRMYSSVNNPKVRGGNLFYTEALFVIFDEILFTSQQQSINQML